MQTLIKIFQTYPIICSIYLIVGVVFWGWAMRELGKYIKMAGLDYRSGLYANMTAQQQRIEYNRYKLKTWLLGIAIMTIFATFWPITIFFKLRSKK